MAGNTNRTALGYGHAYIAAYNSVTPEALPADTVTRDGSWGGNWVDLGYTANGGVKASVNNEYRHIEVDQSTVEVRSYVTKQDVLIELTLREIGVENLKYAMGFGTLSTSGSSGVLAVADNPLLTEYSIGLEGPSASSITTEATRISYYRCVPVSEPEVTFSREEETLVTAKFKILRHTAGALYQIRQYRSAG